MSRRVEEPPRYATKAREIEAAAMWLLTVLRARDYRRQQERLRNALLMPDDHTHQFPRRRAGYDHG